MRTRSADPKCAPAVRTRGQGPTSGRDSAHTPPGPSAESDAVGGEGHSGLAWVITGFGQGTFQGEIARLGSFVRTSRTRLAFGRSAQKGDAGRVPIVLDVLRAPTGQQIVEQFPHTSNRRAKGQALRPTGAESLFDITVPRGRQVIGDADLDGLGQTAVWSGTHWSMLTWIMLLG